MPPARNWRTRAGRRVCSAPSVVRLRNAGGFDHTASARGVGLVPGFGGALSAGASLPSPWARRSRKQGCRSTVYFVASPASAAAPGLLIVSELRAALGTSHRSAHACAGLVIHTWEDAELPPRRKGEHAGRDRRKGNVSLWPVSPTQLLRVLLQTAKTKPF